MISYVLENLQGCFNRLKALRLIFSRPQQFSFIDFSTWVIFWVFQVLKIQFISVGLFGSLPSTPSPCFSMLHEIWGDFSICFVFASSHPPKTVLWQKSCCISIQLRQSMANNVILKDSLSMLTIREVENLLWCTVLGHCSLENFIPLCYFYFESHVLQTSTSDKESWYHSIFCHDWEAGHTKTVECYVV